MKQETVVIDGSEGEGGGQVLRSSLSLSMITGKPFHIKNIRAGRKKPGLLRQHLTAVKAASEICDAKIVGAEMGSQELSFTPGEVKGGTYHFSIGTAGSTTLVAQTVIPALMLADEPSTLTLEGGTHNMQSPPFDFLEYSFLPILEKMGVSIESTIHNYGFFPAGGGKVTFNIKPAKKLKSIELLKRGDPKSKSAEVLFAKLSDDIPKREIKIISKRMKWDAENLHIRQINNSICPGNVVFIKLKFDEVTEIFTGFGTQGVRAEKVAELACKEAVSYLNTEAAVGEHLADQLLLPISLAGKGKFTTLYPSQHTKTNIEIIKKFLSKSINLEEVNENLWQISIS